SEVDLTLRALRHVEGPVDPGSDDEVLSVARRLAARLRPRADEVLDRARQEDVEPAAEVRDGRVDVAMPVADVPAPPERAVIGMGQEIVVPIVQSLDQGVRAERQLAVPARDLLERLLQHALPPRLLVGTPGQPRKIVVGPLDGPLPHEAELEGAAVIDPLG